MLATKLWLYNKKKKINDEKKYHIQNFLKILDVMFYFHQKLKKDFFYYYFILKKYLKLLRIFLMDFFF